MKGQVMNKVGLISYEYKTPNSYGKRINAKELNSSVKNLVKELIARNPQITEQQIMLEINSYIATIEQNGTKLGSLKQKTLGGINQTIKEAQQELNTERYLKKQQIKAKLATPVSEIPSDVIRANSNMPLEKASQPTTVTQPQTEVTTKPQVESSVPKAEIKEETYISSKKKKAQKKQAEINSHLEKQAARRANGKAGRNAQYLTSNQLMSTQARRTYEMVENNNLHFSANRAIDSAEVFREVKSAKDSADVFIKNGYTPIKSAAQESAEVFVQNGITPYERALSKIEELQRSTVNPRVRESVRTVTREIPVEKVVEKEVIKEVVKEVPKTEIKEVVKEVPKTNKWAIAGAVLAGGILTWLGSKLLSNKQSA